MTRRIVMAIVVSLAVASCSSASQPAPQLSRPVHDELPIALDNGGAGLTAMSPPGHLPPPLACHDKVHATKQSLVIRVLPDGPRARSGGPAFTSGVCVYLPPGYATSALKYPVVYLLHGGGGDQANGVTYGHIQTVMDGLIAEDRNRAAIIVMPDGANGQWYDSVNGDLRNEEYVTKWVVPYIDRHLRTIAARKARAIVGVSNGGYGAMLFAEKDASLFAAAGGMSSNLDAVNDATGAKFSGLRDADGAAFHANHPIELVARLAKTDLVLDIADRCSSTDPAALCATQVLDAVFLGPNRAFVAAVRAQTGRTAQLDYREDDGAHQWYSWSQQLRDHQLPFLLARLANPSKA
jgi:S-formylglutathione hydrolase FrmB